MFEVVLLIVVLLVLLDWYRGWPWWTSFKNFWKVEDDY